jgi:DNA-binding CsgD family transcriptional regulator
VIQRADRQIGLERYREVLGVLTARELAVVALVMDGLSVTEAAEMLGIGPRGARR